MSDFHQKILNFISKKTYQPIKPKALARKLNIGADVYGDFRRALRDMIRQGQVEMGRNHLVKPAQPHGAVTGVFRRVAAGFGFVRPQAIDGKVGPEILIRESHTGDAATGDVVLVRILKKPNRSDLGPVGEITQVLERATRQFVGTYFEREGQGLVRVDGDVFRHSIFVGDPGAKGAKPDDKVVFEMLRFPTPEDRGEGVIAEILGQRGQPGVDTLSVIRAYALPDVFPADALEEARQAAATFDERDLEGRDDFTREVIITIDPADAHDFDDAISLTIDPKSKHWQLGVHIADVGHFAPPGGALDREARKRATSVYLPQRVIPMFPELISNGLASLQQGKVRFTKSALMDFTPQGQRANVRFANGAIKVTKRFSYEQVSEILALEGPPEGLDEEVYRLLLRMRDLALILRKRRLKRGALELVMPEPELEYDEAGKVSGAHFRKHDISHEMIEEFMLSANEAVAEHLDRLHVPFLRRVHPAPEPTKLEAFATFARSLGYKIEQAQDRFSLQRVLQQSAGKPDVYAVHYALLRSLKKAAYAPDDEEHYALASADYCHFTSPIRRYPDLTVHRQLGQWLRTGRTGGDEEELSALGDHCSRMERRAETAERELIKVRLLDYLSHRLGTTLEVVITGVADYGFFGQAEHFPVEGLVHISTLNDDYYYYDEATHSLTGQRTRRRYRLGDKVQVEVVRVDLQRRQLDFRVRPEPLPPEPKGRKKKR
ncbi:MAG: ribonuclease R [Planctomycetia bacterium]|nr:ribonuclease R [Planctomycetia bacterium]